MPYKSGVAYGTDKDRGGDYGGTKSYKPTKMGWSYEQCQDYGRGNCAEGNDICVMLCGAGNRPDFL